MNETEKKSESVVFMSYEKVHKISHFSNYFLLTYTFAYSN